MMRKITHPKTPLTRPLTGAEIRECEARVAARSIDLNQPTTNANGEGLGGVTQNHPTTNHKGDTHQPPPTPTYIPKGIYRGLGGGMVGGSTPVTPTPLQPASVGGGEGSPKKTHSKRTKKTTLTIIEDVKEKTPLTSWPEGVQVVRKNLHTGDYTVEGFETSFTIERKSIEDLAGTMLGDYEASSEKPKKRFNRELERMRHFDLKAVIVTATPDEVINFRHHCGMDAHAALWGFGLSVFANYGIPVFYLGDEATAARWVADLARHYVVARTKKNFTKEDRSVRALVEWGF